MVTGTVNALWFNYKDPLLGLACRAAFPLFCYATAVAVLREAPVLPSRYIRRMLLLAVLAQPFYWFAMGGSVGNAVFTLALGGIFASFSENVQPWKMYLLYAIVLTAMLPDIPIQFGLAGAMLPSAILMAMRGEKPAFLFLLALLFTVGAGDVWGYLIYHNASYKTLTGFLLNGGSGIVLSGLVILIASLLRQRGRWLPRYLLHMLYPAHLALLKLFIPAIFR